MNFTARHGFFGHLSPKEKFVTFAVVAFLLPAASLPARQAAPSATIRVNLAEEKAPVPESLQGIFMEEINHAFDGGIYGELIQNRSFEEGVLPPGIELIKRPNGSLKM